MQSPGTTSTLCIVLCSLILVPAATAQNASFVQVQGFMSFSTTAIATFDQLMNLVSDVSSRRLSEQRVLQKIKTGGLTFRLTPDQMEQLEGAGASQRILDKLKPFVIVQKDIPPPKHQGSLIVLCEPVDCAFSITGQSSGETEKGKSAPVPLAEGSYAVRASAKGYRTDQPEKPVSIRDNSSATLVFRFEPDPAALAAAGKELFDRVVSVLGGPPTIQAASRFRARGSLSFSDRSGNESLWDLTVLFEAAPDTAKFVLKRANQVYTVLYKAGSGYTWEKAPTDAPNLEDVLMLSCHHFQIANLLGLLSGKQFNMAAARLVPVQGADSTLRAEGSPDTYLIQIDQYLHVKEVRIESPGLNNGMRALYGDYSGGNRVYAGLTQVLLPDAPRHGVEIHYTSVEYSPADMTGRDFVIKPGKKRR